MPGIMPHNEAKARILKKLMTSQESYAGGKSALPKAKLIIKGSVELSPIYRFRVSDLYYNKANGRIKAEVSELEAELGRDLDIGDKGDRTRIRDLLLSIRKDENEKIREDLKKNGQLQPGIVTCDGILINGNRRQALLETLFEETHNEKYSSLDAHVLPSDITKSEVWLIEAGIQLSTPQQLDYSPINHLLKLREGLNAGLDVDDMAQRIYGIDEVRLHKDLSRIDLIDDYLTEFLQKPGRYHLVSGLAEHFIDLQNILEWVEKPKGRFYRDWYPGPSDRIELKLIAFYYIRDRFEHMRIRDLRKLFFREKAWGYLRKTIEIDIEADVADGDSRNIEEEIDDDNELDFESAGDSVAISGALVEAEKRAEKIWQQKASGDLHSHFEDAMEQQSIEKDIERPLALARRALRQIEAIPIGSKDLANPEINRVFSKIILKVNDLRKKAQKYISTNSGSQDGKHTKKDRRDT